MNGAEIKSARERLGMTQQQLAARLGVGARTVGNWERGETVPRNRLGMVRQVLGAVEERDDPIRAASDVALLSELLRRAAERNHATG